MVDPWLFRPSAATLRLLERLVAFDTAAPRGNLPPIDYARETLAAAGAVCRLLPDGTGEKAGLLARFGPAGMPRPMLSGHTDVVPVTGQAWTSDPRACSR